MSASDALAKRVVISEIVLRLSDDHRFGETFIRQGEGGIFGKDFSAVSTSEADAPGINDANQITFPDAELSGRDIMPGKVATFFYSRYTYRVGTRKRERAPIDCSP